MKVADGVEMLLRMPQDADLEVEVERVTYSVTDVSDDLEGHVVIYVDEE